MHLPPDILDFESCPEVFSGRKITETHVLLMFELIYKDPACPTRLIREQMVQYHQVQVHVTDRHINRLRAKWGFSRHKGRPKKNPVQESDVQSQLPVVRPNLGFVGVHIFDDWLEQKGGFSEVIKLLMIAISEYRKEHPDESFSLLNHKNETLLLRFKALFYAPLFGIEKLTEYDIKEHALETVTGRGYQNSTLRQFLGHLERIDAGTNLMPALLPTESGNICYIDGHMIAFWTKTSMHKGKITMLGRIMAGSQAVVAHNDAGHALYVEYYPPDIRLPRVILEYCEWIKNSTGIELFVIDREVNSLKMAQAFEEREWGLLSMLNSNEYKALSDWDVEHIGELEDGSQVYKGKWASPRKKDDPRIFVIVETKDRLLPYWGTPKVEELLNALEWPRVYSERTEIQENSFKRMRDHGALNINFGVKKITGPDRHQERTVVTLKNKLSKNQEKIQGTRYKIIPPKPKRPSQAGKKLIFTLHGSKPFFRSIIAS